MKKQQIRGYGESMWRLFLCASEMAKSGMRQQERQQLALLLEREYVKDREALHNLLEDELDA